MIRKLSNEEKDVVVKLLKKSKIDVDESTLHLINRDVIRRKLRHAQNFYGGMFPEFGRIYNKLKMN